MLVDSTSKKRVLTTISFRADEQIVKEFKQLCKKHNVKQISIIENAMKKAIEEMKEMENGQDEH